MDDAGRKLDDLLTDFVRASDNDADHALETLYLAGIEPVAADVIRHKLHVSLRSDNEDHVNQVGLDLLSGVKATLLPVLRHLRSTSETASIGNFSAYIKAVALNAYRQYLRDKYPNRLRLRNKVRYILTRRPDYEIWKHGSGIALCGLSEWSRQEMPALGAGAIETIQLSLSRDAVTSGTQDHNADILILIGSIFEKAAAPVTFEDLVSIVWAALGLSETQTVSETDGGFDFVRSNNPSIEQRLDDRLSLERLWVRICTMPLRHRQAVLLNLHDANGDNLLALFPSLGIASIRQIAAALEYDAEDLAALWSKLPLDDMTIAERMRLTRQQVINLRQSARASLRRGLI